MCVCVCVCVWMCARDAVCLSSSPTACTSLASSRLQVGTGDTWHLGGLEVRVFDTPGHTRGHITYWVPQAASLFPGGWVGG